MLPTKIKAEIFALALACLASPAFAKGKNDRSPAPEADDGETKDSKPTKRDRWARYQSGTIDFTLQPGGIDATGGNGPYPNFEILYAKPRLGPLPLHVGLAYWGIEKDVSSSNYSYESGDNFGDTPTDAGEQHTHFSMHAVVLRAKLFLSPGFYFNFGFGWRYARTHEFVDYDDGRRESAFKEATSLGTNVGFGNRFAIGRWYYLGANWLEVFHPVSVLKSKDAEFGREAGYLDSTRKHDGWRESYRTLTFELGRLW